MNNNDLPTRAEYQRSHKKTKKHFYRRWWFWTIIAILLLAGGGFLGMKMTATGPYAPTTKVSKKKSTTKKSTAKKGITLSQYKGIYISDKDGLSPDQIEKAIGKSSATSVSATSQNNIYTWNTIANGELGSKLTISFNNNHAIGKTISGIKVNRSEKLGLDSYNSIQNDQTQDTILKNVGKPNGYNDSSSNGKITQTWTYSSGVKGNTGANFIISFSDGKVTGKSQSGIE